MAGTPIADEVSDSFGNRDSDGPFAQEQAALAKREPTLAAVGTAFPDAKLLSATGEPVTLVDTLAGRPGVIIFYRGAWCPYCNVALNRYRADLAEPLHARGISLVAISPQRPDGSMTMQEKHNLKFPVLSDPGNQLARLLGILTEPSAESRQAQLDHGLDLTEVNADGTTTLPMPTTAIVDSEYLLRWIDVHPDYATRTEPGQILNALAELGL
ncbi:peroxiredoxin-like family protein [Microlunatus sp. Gsoil 973]|uniref:peroxiredoxin-like family protein n=1 Tax=Microlunatus sp. Gsoil 973 TaxID=2672569 RepID=UPI0012B4623F|nr:peroxiredoxin-like family protein [Microlunatus sp. Gsoil 973]QGN33254.1 redoxin domain-containing protein [Microlunatus sp. Gsoil 973]